jgi:hypothetical protein
VTEVDLTLKEVEVAGAPDPIVQPRAREVWTNDAVKGLRRATRLLTEHNLQVYVLCGDCKTQLTQENGDGAGIDLVCACKRRVVRRGA